MEKDWDLGYYPPPTGSAGQGQRDGELWVACGGQVKHVRGVKEFGRCEGACLISNPI